MVETVDERSMCTVRVLREEGEPSPLPMLCALRKREARSSGYSIVAGQMRPPNPQLMYRVERWSHRSNGSKNLYSSSFYNFEHNCTPILALNGYVGYDFP